MKKISIALSIVFSLVLSLLGTASALAAGPATINILSAGNYVILAKTAITTTGVTAITGNLGISPAAASAMTGFAEVMDGSGTFSTSALVNGNIYAADYTAPTPATLTTDVSAMEAAYTDGATRTPGVGASNLNVGAGTLSGQNFVPGTYTWNGGSSNVTITGNITLTGSASDIWIFQVAGTLNLANAQQIILAGGAQPSNVFWVVAGAVTLITSSQFQGIILAQTNIAMQAGATLNGRALAQTAVTLIGNTVGISAPVAVTPRRRTPYVAPIVPIIGLLKVPTPLSLPNGPGKVTYNYTVSNVGKLQQLMDIKIVDDKCTPVVLISGDVNTNERLDINEEWKYTCSSMITATTTNTAVATAHSTDGYYNTAIATAIATVVVSNPIQPPLINIVKVPSQLTPFPYGGGDITYTYTVKNPGVVPMNSIVVSDDKCPSIYFVSGDNNGNNLLDVSETWVYTCKTKVQVSTSGTANATGNANGLKATAYSFVNVLVDVPSLPNTGFGIEGITVSWLTVILLLIIMVLSAWLYVVSSKTKGKTKI